MNGLRAIAGAIGWAMIVGAVLFVIAAVVVTYAGLRLA